MSLRFLLLFFGVAHSFALLSKDLQNDVNKKLIPSDLVKMKAADPNWKGQGMFERITEVAGLFVHKETNEIILETKDKLWTESEIIEELEYENFGRRTENLIDTKDWNQLLILLKRGADVSAKQNLGWTALENGWTALHIAALENRIELIKLFLEFNAEIDARDESGMTPLMMAVQWSSVDAVKVLLERGAHSDLKDNDGYTALHFAAARNKIEVIELLLEYKVKIDATTNFEETPLMKAVMRFDAVKMLLERGARFDLKNNNGCTALDIAKQCRRQAIEISQIYPFDIPNEKIIELLEEQQNKALLEQKKSEN